MKKFIASGICLFLILCASLNADHITDYLVNQIEALNPAIEKNGELLAIDTFNCGYWSGYLSGRRDSYSDILDMIESYD